MLVAQARDALVELLLAAYHLGAQCRQAGICQLHLQQGLSHVGCDFTVLQERLVGGFRAHPLVHGAGILVAGARQQAVIGVGDVVGEGRESELFTQRHALGLHVCHFLAQLGR